jgi:hypothetical protein
MTTRTGRDADSALELDDRLPSPREVPMDRPTKHRISLARRNLCTSIAVLVGWRTTARMPTELPLDALKMAL